MDIFNKLAEQFIRMNRRLRKWKRGVSALAAIVVFATTYALVLPAITLDKETADAQAGIEIAASDNDPDSDGTVYAAEPEEEPAEEIQEEEAGEQQDAEAVTEDSGAESESREAEESEEENAEEDTAADDYGQDADTEEPTDSMEEDPADEDTAPDSAEAEEPTAETLEETLEEGETAEEIRLITEETQLIYEYVDEEYENGIDDENDDGIDDGYTVYAEFGADAKLPEGVELQAEEITKESDPELYEAYYEKALSGLQDKYDENTALSFARFYDIRFVYNGEEVEPSGDVKVRIEYKKAVKVEKETTVDAVHFDKNNDEEPEVIDSETTAEKKGRDDTVKTVEFESDQFSVYGIIGSYTVDFHWEVDGKTYEFSIPGGGSVSFGKLAEVLGLAGDDDEKEGTDESAKAQEESVLTLDDVEVSDETKDFVADVEKVEFSSPELVWVEKVDDESTVGSLKETNGLEVEYSKDLTEEQIEEINAQTVEVGDWALISMQPFTSEETLTVTMKDGEVFTIKVTDGQIHAYVISDSGKAYKITVTYDETTGIPADAELRVRQLTPEDKRYQDDIDRSNAALLAKYDQEATNPLVFEIKIFADGKEIEPIEGTKVSVEISLAMDMATGQLRDESESGKTEAMDAAGDEAAAKDTVEGEAGESLMLFDGVEYTLVPAEEGQNASRVVHLTDDGEAVVIEDLDSKVDADNNVVLNFETESFSDYMVQGVNNVNGLSSLPDTIYVGDEIYMQNSANMWVTDIGSVVTETKFDGDNYKSVRAISTGTFRICHSSNWNGGNPSTWNSKVITVLPARSDGNNGQPYPGTTPPATVPTVSNASIGLTLNLFDYDRDDSLDNRFNNKDFGDHLNYFKDRGINSGHSLKFWGSGITDSSYGAQNNYVEHGVTNIVNSNLSGGYPTLKSDNTSLDYLFTPSDGTDKKAYLNADGLFRKDGDYYVYNSNENYAWYDPSTNKFEVYNTTYKQKLRGDGGEQATQLADKAIGFFPFHKWDDQYDLYVNWDKNLNHHFGMSMSVQFSLPKDPKAVVDTNNLPIIFDFSGDDDLWVFIDGKLAMDIGGIHQPTSGTINFQDQTVTANGQRQSFDFSGLYDGELHTLQVFYIERGGCDSNCMIKFNLTQYGDVEFDKVDKENTSDKLGGAIFGLYKDAACTQPLMENLKDGTSRAYVAESDASGHVKFSDIPLGDYFLKEIKAPDGYPLDSTVHPVKVYLDENSLVTVKVSIDGIDIVDPGVQIPNKKPEPITLGLKKEWKDQNENTIPAPANTSATFELKRIRTYERITEETTVEGHDEQSSHLVVGWYHNGQYHIHNEYDLVAGSTATISWSYVDGYTGSKDCYENGTRIDKDYVTSSVVSEAVTMPAAGGTATLYIVDESENGDAIKNINVAGEQFYGTSGGGVIHKFETITEPDPDFQYTGDLNVVNNQVTLPVEGDTPWEYDFVNLPLAGRIPNTPTTYSYTYYLEEVSSVSPEGTTVIYKDRQGNVINNADDAETNVTGDQTVTNKVDLGALELTKKITVTDANNQTQPMTQPNQWVNGTVNFTIDGVEDTFTEGIHHDVEITYAAGKITGYKIDTTQTAVDPAVTGTTYSILVNNLVPGDYVIRETGSSNLALTEITGGKNDANLEAKTITVTVTHGKNTASQLDATAKAAFTNNIKTINVPATKTWADLKEGTTHPTIYFRLFYHTEAGDVAVNGVKLKPLPNGTTTVTWENVPKFDQNGQEYVYLVKEYIQKDGGEFTEDDVSYTEAAPNGYVATEEGLSVTNTESDKYDPRTSYTGRKVWVDTANNGATRPSDLVVKLMVDKTGNGPSADDTEAVNADGQAYTPVWRKDGDEWTYTFNNLPVYDADWNIVHYYAVETPVAGYQQDEAAMIGTEYVYKNSYNAQHIPNDTDVTISSEIHLLPFMAIETRDNAYGYMYHVWTVRVATDAEKAELVRIFNVERGGNAITLANTRFVSGLPVSRASDGNVEFLYRAGPRGYKISISKTSGDVLKVEVDGRPYMAEMIVGTLEYDYSAGSTDLQNTLKTEDYDIQKTWGDGQTPPEGAEVQFTLTATIPGTATEENPNPDPVAITDLTTLGIAKQVITLNGGQKDGEEYTGDDTTEAPWVYSWKGLPQYDKNGNKITYSASETRYMIGEETVDITSEGLVPPTTSDETYELITTNRIPTEDISAQKYWPEGQTVPEGTLIKLAITAKLEDGTDPNGVTVTPATVTLDGKVTAGDPEEVETEDTLWQYTWTNLPKYDKDGKKVTYTVAETEYKIGEISYEDLLANANDPAHEGVDFSFTNELPVTEITVEKTWSNNTGEWPDGVSVIMTLKGSAPIGENGEMKEIETLVLPDIEVGEEPVPQTAQYALSSVETSHTWTKLPMYTLDGKPITYTVDETGMTYTQPGEEPVSIQNWAQAFTVVKEEDEENNKVMIDNTPLETEISLTKVWTVNGQPKTMEDGDSIEFKLYRTDAEGELTLSADGYAADKGTATLNKILYVADGENPGWQTVTISKLTKYVLKLETTNEGTIARYTGIAYYAVETRVGENTRISYTMSPMNASSGGDGEEGSEDPGTTGPSETTDPTQSAIGTGTITIYNRDTDVDITVLKVDETDSDKKLPNAEFQILKWNEDDERYVPYNLETKDYAAQGQESKSKLSTGSEGTLVFEGLLDGRYKVVETKAPDGYINLGNVEFFFRIDDGTVTWTDENDTPIVTEDDSEGEDNPDGQDDPEGEDDPEGGNKPNQVDYDDLTFTVGNTPGAALPHTGGSGTSMFRLIGLIFTAMACTGFMMRRKKKAA